MNYFVLFSLMIIALCVGVLLIPSSEGFSAGGIGIQNPADIKPPVFGQVPGPANQRNAAIGTASSDGSSSIDSLLGVTLSRHNQIAEAFENRDKSNKASAVSATTTKKKGIASTGASVQKKGMSDHVIIPKTGCNENKCVEIGKTQSAFDPLAAIGGNCVNPPLANGEPDYSTKYCPAFQPKDDTIDDQECMTCGYYKYTADCLRHADPKDSTKCTLYGDYKYNQPPDGATYYSGSMPPGTNGGDDGGDDGGDGEPICSATTCGPKTVTVDGTQCIIPGCVSNDGGMMPYPDDFYGNRTTNPCYPIKDDKGGTNGFMCPAITSGEVYDMGGGSSDLCYTTGGVVDPTKFLKIDNACSNDKPKSRQNFKPGKDAPIDDNDTHPSSRRSAIKYQHSGAINVYHHLSHHPQQKQGHPGNSTKHNGSSAYSAPVGGATVLGYL
jgi:hypothetical protein